MTMTDKFVIQTPASRPESDYIQDTLHGGIYGWDRRNWTIVARNQTSVTYFHLDRADEGFPGFVEAHVSSSLRL